MILAEAETGRMEGIGYDIQGKRQSEGDRIRTGGNLAPDTTYAHSSGRERTSDWWSDCDSRQA